jgi:transposase
MHFIGLDAHSRNCFFVVVGRGGKILCKERVVTNEGELVRFIRSVRGREKLIFEETSLSQWLYLLLKDEVEELIVCRPEGRQGAKTDWIDATELAESLRNNNYRSVFHTDDPMMELRTLVSGYGDLVQELTQMKNRYSALFRQAAIFLSKRGELYKSSETISLLPTKTMRFVASPLLERIWLLEEQKYNYEMHFGDNVKKIKAIGLLTTIPGIAAVRANQIAGVVVSPHRFANKYKFFAYAMLVKHQKISDGKIYGKKRPFGQALLKDVFKSGALSALRGKNRFTRHYQACIAKGLDDCKARNSVSRLLAATALGVWKSGKKYDDNYDANHKEVTQRLTDSCHSETESL